MRLTRLPSSRHLIRYLPVGAGPSVKGASFASRRQAGLEPSWAGAPEGVAQGRIHGKAMANCPGPWCGARRAAAASRSRHVPTAPPRAYPRDLPRGGTDQEHQRWPTETWATQVRSISRSRAIQRAKDSSSATPIRDAYCAPPDAADNACFSGRRGRANGLDQSLAHDTTLRLCARNPHLSRPQQPTALHDPGNCRCLRHCQEAPHQAGT